ncbi:MAG: hypothetical protein ACYTGV_15890, partial [Planctomycetota bacterium]
TERGCVSTTGENGVTTCGNAECHSDADPSAYTPVDEDIPPPYYSSSDAEHPDIPDNACNYLGLEDYAGTSIGLDNDGDNDYDELDVIPCPEPGESAMLTAGIGLLLVIGQRRAQR